jgi:HK97 gp10 family phage protein
MASIFGYKELSKQLSALGKSVGGKAFRAAANAAMKPAVAAAKAAAPVGHPPYGPYPPKTTTQDPYPKPTYLGRLVTPGFASRSVATKVTMSRDKTEVTVMLGVKPEAFYAVQFIELGTSSSPKRPWLEPSFRASLPAVDARFKDELKARMDKAAKS